MSEFSSTLSINRLKRSVQVRKQRSRRLSETFHFIWHNHWYTKASSNMNGTSVDVPFPEDGKGRMDLKRTNYTVFWAKGAFVTNSSLFQMIS